MNTGKKSADIWEEFDCSVGSSTPTGIASLSAVFQYEAEVSMKLKSG